MSMDFVIKEQFNDFCASGDLARQYLTNTVIPCVENNPNEVIVFDFSDVKMMNSSFANALIGNALAIYGKERIRVKNLRDELKVIVVAALVYGDNIRKSAKHSNSSESIIQSIKNAIGIK